MRSIPDRRVIAAAPCRHCPFRKDVPIYLRPRRRKEIARSLADGGTFPCHGTIDYDHDDGPDTSRSSGCAGAEKALMLDGGSTQMGRIAERLGLVDLDKTAATGADVWPLSEWTRLQEGATGEDPGELLSVEPCSVANPGCVAPAGYLSPGGVVVRGTVAAEYTCDGCGDPVCSECITDSGFCPYCTDDEEDLDGWP